MGVVAAVVAAPAAVLVVEADGRARRAARGAGRRAGRARRRGRAAARRRLPGARRQQHQPAATERGQGGAPGDDARPGEAAAGPLDRPVERRQHLRPGRCRAGGSRTRRPAKGSRPSGGAARRGRDARAGGRPAPGTARPRPARRRAPRRCRRSRPSRRGRRSSAASPGRRGAADGSGGRAAGARTRSSVRDWSVLTTTSSSCGSSAATVAAALGRRRRLLVRALGRILGVTGEAFRSGSEVSRRGDGREAARPAVMVPGTAGPSLGGPWVFPQSRSAVGTRAVTGALAPGDGQEPPGCVHVHRVPHALRDQHVLAGGERGPVLARDAVAARRGARCTEPPSTITTSSPAGCTSQVVQSASCSKQLTSRPRCSSWRSSIEAQNASPPGQQRDVRALGEVQVGLDGVQRGRAGVLVVHVPPR